MSSNPASDRESRPEFEDPGHETQGGVSPTRVLLIEDEYDAARLASRRLSWSTLGNFVVTWAASVPDALDHLSGADFDVVLLDLGLPGSEGVSTLASVCGAAKEVPVVVLTGSDDDRIYQAAVANGVQDFLVKQNQDGRTLARAVTLAVERGTRSGTPVGTPAPVAAVAR